MENSCSKRASSRVRGRVGGSEDQDTSSPASVTLGRLVFAWIVVAAWFEVATVVTNYVVNRLALPRDATIYLGIPRRVLVQRLVEAALVTLIASLWFDSLGSGGWWLLFALVGALVTLPQWVPRPERAPPNPVLLVRARAGPARPEIAGAPLPWGPC